MGSDLQVFNMYERLFILLIIGTLVYGSDTDTSVEVSSNCKEGWMDASSLNMGCLYFNHSDANGVSWFDASTYCYDHNSYLLEIQTVDQLDFIRMALTVLETEIDNDSNRYWWTGGMDLNREGLWYWSHTLTEVGEFVWHQNEPDGGIAQNFMCLDSTPDREYYAADCCMLYNGHFCNCFFICQS